MAWVPLTDPIELQGKHETSIFDWKRRYDLTKPDTKFEMAKDVAAFAGAAGGTIAIGAIEGSGPTRGYIVNFESVQDPVRLIDELGRGVRELCRPLPVFHPIAHQLNAQTVTQILGRPSSDPATIVLVNVPPLPSGPVGVTYMHEDGTKSDGAFKFPMRGGEGTKFLQPEELALYMATHERRIALLLRRIPGTEAEGDMVNVTLSTFSYRDASGKSYPHRLIRIDEEAQYIVLENVSEGDAYRAHVPLAYIRGVWQSADRTKWFLDVNGTVFEMGKGDFAPPHWPR